MSDYTSGDQRTWGSGDDCLRIKVFSADDVTRAELDTAYNAIEDAVNDIYYDDYWAPEIDYAKINQYETNATFGCPYPGDGNGGGVGDNDKEDNETSLRDDFNNWLNNHNFTEKGCYLWLTNCPAAYTWNNAWYERTVSLLAPGRYNYFDIMAIHEVFHAYIDHYCSHVEDMTSTDEHDLSTVYNGELTPLGASYGNDAQTQYHQSGDCSGQNFTSRRRELSTCAKEAVSLSIEHKNDWGHDL